MAIFKRSKKNTMTPYGAVKIGDSVDTVKSLSVGYYMKDDLKKGIFTEQDISDNLDKFYAEDYGKASAKTIAQNRKSVDEEKGNITGIYPSTHNDANPSDVMIIHYNADDDAIYVLDHYDFVEYKKGWMDPIEFEKNYMTTQNVVEGATESGTDPKTGKAINESLSLPDPKKVYNEPGLQYNTAQKEYIRGQDLTRKDEQLSREMQEELRQLRGIMQRRPLKKKEQERLDEIMAEIKRVNNENKENKKMYSEMVHYYGIVHNSEIEAGRHLLETGKDSRGLPVKGFDGTWMPQLKFYADKLGLDLDKLLERFQEYQQVNHYNAKKSFDTLIKKLKDMSEGKYPHYIATDSLDDINIDDELEALEIKYEDLLGKEQAIMDKYRDDEDMVLTSEDKEALDKIHDEMTETVKQKKYLEYLKTGEVPEEVNEELVDEIVYSEDWPVSFEDVAHKITDTFKDIGVAVKCVKDYLKNNPSEKKHFKDADVNAAIDYKKFDPDVYAVCYQVKDKSGKEFVGEDDIAFAAYSEKDLRRRIKSFLNGKPEHDYEFYVKYFNENVDGKEIKDDNEFMEKTHQGYEVVTIYENENGRKFIVGFRPKVNSYFVGAGYNPNDGIWAQGYYDYKSEKEAADWLYDHYGDEGLKVIYHK